MVSVVCACSSSGEDRTLNPECFVVSPRSCTSGLELSRPAARCLAIVVASPNVSKKLRSLTATSRPAPVTPFWSVSHSSSVKSPLPAMCAPFFRDACKPVDLVLLRADRRRPVAVRVGCAAFADGSEDRRGARLVLEDHDREALARLAVDEPEPGDAGRRLRDGDHLLLHMRDPVLEILRPVLEPNHH